jgi:hypothetical protein
MPRQRPAQPPVQAFVDQDTHGSDRFQQAEFAGFDHSHDLCARHGREALQEFVDGFAAFERVDEVLQRHSRADEDRRTAHDVGDAMDDLRGGFDGHVIVLAGASRLVKLSVPKVASGGSAGVLAWRKRGTRNEAAAW